MGTKLKQIDHPQGGLKYRVNPDNLMKFKDMCINSGLSPSQIIPKEILAADAFNQLLSRNAALISAARPVMYKAFTHFVGTTELILLCDSRGYIINIVSSPETIQSCSRRGIVLGACLACYSYGINAVSMVLYEGRTTVVTGGEHYGNSMKSWNGVAAPIKAEGEIKGYIDISYQWDSDLIQFIPTVVLMAELIEARLKITAEEKSKLADGVRNLGNEKINPIGGLARISKAEFFGRLIVASAPGFTKKESEIL
jgi:transcriptional regulator of acetoin/glycerol metabolism